VAEWVERVHKVTRKRLEGLNDKGVLFPVNGETREATWAEGLDGRIRDQRSPEELVARAISMHVRLTSPRDVRGCYPDGTLRQTKYNVGNRAVVLAFEGVAGLFLPNANTDTSRYHAGVLEEGYGYPEEFPRSFMRTSVVFPGYIVRQASDGRHAVLLRGSTDETDPAATQLSGAFPELRFYTSKLVARPSIRNK